MGVEEAELLVGVRAVDAFEEFYRREFPLVYRASFLASGERDRALDATQEAFGRAFARWRRLSKASWAGGWVMTTALNLVRKPERKAAGEDRRPLPAPPVERVLVEDALRSLPRRQRQALILFYIADLPLPAIAELMKIAQGTVKAHLAQGRAALRERLGECNG